MFDECQFRAGMQLPKVYLIHEGLDEKDAATRTAKDIFRGQGIGDLVRIEPRALVRDADD